MTPRNGRRIAESSDIIFLSMKENVFFSAALWRSSSFTGQPQPSRAPDRSCSTTIRRREWNQALPLGNGRLGAMVFGNVNAERIQLNENTLWMGGPRDTNNPDALKHLAEVRRLLFAGLPVEAYAVAEKHSMGRPFRLESYQTLGDLRLTFDHEGTPTDYRFELDIDSAIARLTYRLGGVLYTREVFASHPAQAIVVRLTADAPGKLNVSTWIDRLQDATTEVVGNDRLDLVGALGGGKGLSFLASVRFLPRAVVSNRFPSAS